MSPFCIPTPGSCPAADRGHWCDFLPAHDGPHHCDCPQGHHWERDTEAELARVLYLRHWTIPYLDAPEIPPRAAVDAATGPGSTWRAMARAAMNHLGVTA